MILQSKKNGKDQELIQLSTTPDPGKVTNSQSDITNEATINRLHTKA